VPLKHPIDLLPERSDLVSKDPLRRSKGLTLIPVEDETFFLPPPFLPNHPVLQTLCESSVKFLNTRHREFEAEIVHFMQQKTDEMRALEDQVRNEVDMLWTVFRTTNPDTKAVISGRRGSKVEDPRSRSREPPQRKFSPSPVVLNTFKQNQARSRGTGDDQLAQSHLDIPVGNGGEQSFAAGSLLTSALSANPQRPPESQDESPLKSPETTGEQSTLAVGSLLTKSLSANPHKPEPPADPPIKSPEETANAYLEEAGRLDKKKDGRAVAMSHVFSELDSQIGKLSAQQTQDLHERANRYDTPMPDMVIREPPIMEASPSGSVKEAGVEQSHISPHSSSEEEDKTKQDRHDEGTFFSSVIAYRRPMLTKQTRCSTLSWTRVKEKDQPVRLILSNEATMGSDSPRMRHPIEPVGKRLKRLESSHGTKTRISTIDHHPLVSKNWRMTIPKYRRLPPVCQSTLLDYHCVLLGSRSWKRKLHYRNVKANLSHHFAWRSRKRQAVVLSDHLGRWLKARLNPV
jgi:hypothetical protein